MFGNSSPLLKAEIHRGSPGGSEPQETLLRSAIIVVVVAQPGAYDFHMQALDDRGAKFGGRSSCGGDCRMCFCLTRLS